MLRSSNPILSRKDAFTPAAPQYGQGGQFPGYQTGGPQSPIQDPYGSQTQAPEGRMTFDDVVTKTAVSIAVMIAIAAAAWVLVPDSLMFPALIVSGLVGMVASFVVAIRRVVNPGLVVAFAAVEGIFVGMLSKLFENVYDGIVVQAVLATFAAAAVTLFAYKFFNIRVTPKFRKVVIIGTIAFAVAMLLNFVMSMFGASLGLRGGITGEVSPLMIGISLLGAGLAVLNLVLDFDYIERGIEMGAPAKESWRAAFGLTVTMVWLYIEILRLISYIRR